MTQAAAVLALRAHLWAWRGHLHETRWKVRRVLAIRSALLLVIFGGLGGIGGGFLIGHWAAGLVIIIESAGLVMLGLNQDDGTDVPVLGRRTVDQVLDDERYRE
jgi:hypothetical protein